MHIFSEFEYMAMGIKGEVQRWQIILVRMGLEELQINR